VETVAGKKGTFNFTAGYNPWRLNGNGENNRKLVHLRLEPEYRYWLWERFNGHFLGVNAFYASYNISGRNVPFLFDEEYRYDGLAYGMGISYGFHWMINAAWGVETYVGVGAARLSYDRFDCLKCSIFLNHTNETYFGPTKAGISLIYIIK
jgi:hypothetical protein